MHKIRDILRLHAEHHLTGRQIAQSLGLSHSTVLSVLHRVEALGLPWPLPEELDDAGLEARLYPPTPGRFLRRSELAWEAIHRELRRKGVTLRLLWQEYRRDHPEDIAPGTPRGAAAASRRACAVPCAGTHSPA
ncbi:MAG: hypothetical protein QME77_12825, partial [bacterium]|nr:hypothetical protein [bacterium]